MRKTKQNMTDRPENHSEFQLLEQSLKGNEDAFLLLYERLKEPLFRYAFYMTMSKAAAEEVTQEAFLVLLKNGHRFNPAKGDLIGFAFGVTRNLIQRFKKRQRLYEEFPGDEALDKLSSGRPGITDMSGQTIRNQDVETIRIAIRSLPDHYRQVVVLCDLCELTYSEVASRLECPVGTIRSRLNRAHALLARKLRPTKKPQPELPAAGPEECLI
jgi:RNA polymerase sigma-70 factor (ECF subfamily)